MTRTLVSITAVLFVIAVFFTPSAKAGCISCEYTPPVVNTPVKSKPARTYKKKTYTKKKTYRKKRSTTAKKKSKPTKSKSETAKAKPEAETEQSTVSAAAVDTRAPADETAVTEQSSIAAASSDADAPVDVAEKQSKEREVSEKVDCKKFFPTSEVTLSVPCE